ncbi:MAG: hypothetical protein ACRD15_05660 [Vicinamibacterales bacterium]
MNPNTGLYLRVVTHPWDGCQHNPEQDRGSLPEDAHFLSTPAAFIVGGTWAGLIRYRLCASCARLKRFRRLPQEPITQQLAKGA